MTIKRTRIDSGLSRDGVVDRAVAVADVEGLDAVTIRRLAQEFGVTPMALYWHVSNKDELLAAMGDRLFAGIPFDVSTDEAPWYDQLRALLESLLDAMRAHPALLPLAFDRVMQSEDGRDVTERALTLLRGAGFSVRESANIAAHALRTVIGLVLDQPGYEIGPDGGEREERRRVKRAGIASLPPDRYPNLIDAADDLVACADEDGYDRLGLDLFINGVQALSTQHVLAG